MQNAKLSIRQAQAPEFIEGRFKIQNYFLLMLSLCYFIFRLINLTKLPVFNDEAIYLDWAWRETHEPGLLFYSLYDAKQPLIMWLFGIAMHLLPNPFFAGRFISVLFGFLTMLGIYKIGKTYFNLKIAFLSSLLYIFIPIFSFYDRQALMEAGVGAVGVWIVWFALKFWKKGETKDAVLTGIFLGVGYFMKSSSLIFLLAFFLMSGWFFWKKQIVTIKSILYSACSFLCVIVLLLLQPRFWETLSSNSRYGFGFYDLLAFPVVAWIVNIFGNLEIGLLFVTPIIFLASLTGIVLILKKGKNEQRLLAWWMIVTLVLQILLVRSTSQRYIVSYFPLLALFAMALLLEIRSRIKDKSIWAIVCLVFFIVPCGVTVAQVVQPLSYFQLFSFSRFSEMGSYVTGRTSGYGVDQAIAYVEALPKGRKIFVGESLYTGNPESAIMVWFVKSKVITLGYLDRSLLGDSINGVECIKADVPVYFVSKENDVAGLEKYLQNITYLKNSYNKNAIGIWKLKEQCKGKSLPVKLVNIK